MKRLFIIGLAWLTVTAPVHARVWHVSATRGDDKAAGDEQAPLRTLGAAVGRLRGGDRLIVHEGEYREAVAVTASGTAENPIVIEAARGAHPVIKGSDIISGWEPDAGAVWKKTAFVYQRRRTRPEDPQFWWTDDVRRLFVADGPMWEAVPLARAGARAEMRSGSFFVDRAQRVLYVWLPDGGDPNQVTVEAAVRGSWLRVSGSHVRVRGLAMRHSSTLPIVNWPACVLSGQDIRLERCTLSWADFVAVGLNGVGNALVDCLIACNGNSGIGGRGEQHIIDHCRVLYNNLDRYSPSWHGGGAKLIPDFKHGRIEGNEFAHNLGPGLWLDGRCDENVVARNVCHDNEGPGLMVEISVGNTVLNNLCYGNRNTGGGDFLAPDPNAVAQNRHNVFTTVQRGTDAKSQRYYHAGSGRGIYISSSPQTQVLFNTCCFNQGEGICVDGPLRPAGKDGARISTHDVRVVNNISVHNHGTQLCVARNGRDENTFGNSTDYNLLLARGAILAKQGWGGKDTWSLADWRKTGGWGEHSVEAAPLFLMPAIGDFRPAWSSAARSKALAVPGVAVDLLGRRRPKTGATIGALEAAPAGPVSPWWVTR